MKTATQENKRICIIAASINMGGMQRAAVNICNQLVMHGFDVMLVTLFKHEHFFKLDEKIKFREPYQEVAKQNKISRIFEIVKHIKKSVTTEKPDIVVSYGRFYSALTLYALKNSTIPVFISDRASSEYRDSKFVHLITMLIFKFIKPDGVIAQTSNSAEFQRKLFGDITKIKIIPNSLRNVQLYPDISKQKQILAVGRLGDHLKGFDQLIEAFALLKNKDWELIFAGGDEDGECLKKQAELLNVIDRIRFLGKVQEMDKVYAQAGIFVIPSRSEGFPNALCEAMAAGLPCISFDFVAGPRDIITDEFDGLIIENRNIPKLAEAMDTLIENEKMRLKLGNNAMKIRERLNMDKIGKQFLDFILSNKK